MVTSDSTEKSHADLVALLRCPDSGQTVHEATGEERRQLRELGHPCPEGALVREDGKRAFPIRDSFPVMLADEAISLP